MPQKITGYISEWWYNKGVRFKFIFSVLSLFVVGVIAISAFFTKRTESLLDENLKQKLNLLEKNLSVIVRNSLLESSYTALNTLIKLISRQDKELLHLVVLDRSHTILATSSEKEYPVFYQLSDSFLLDKIKKKDGDVFIDRGQSVLGRLNIIYSKDDPSLGAVDGLLGNSENLDGGFPDEEEVEDPEGEPDPSTYDLEDEAPTAFSHENVQSDIFDGTEEGIQGYMYIALTTRYLESEINQMWLISSVLLLFILSLGAFIAYMIGSGLAKPLALLADKVREITKGNLDTVIKKLPRKDEIGQLVLDTEDMRLSIRSLTNNLEEKVAQRTQMLQLAQNENEKILDTMKTGLLSVDDHHVTGSQYSKISETIFERNNLGNQNFFRIIKTFLSSEKLRMTDKYFTILFNDTIDNAFIYDLNPLQKVKSTFESGSTKYLNFYFERIYAGDKIVGIMIIVEDITEAHMLSKRLEENQKKLDSQMNQLLAILNTDTEALGMFIADSEEDIEELRKIVKIREPGQSHISHIYRIVHSIKGNAALLNLSLISDVAHKGEEDIINIQKKIQIEASDIRLMSSLLSELDNSLKQIKNLITKLQTFKSSFSENSDLNLLMLQSVEKTVERLSKMMEKVVYFDHQKFDRSLLNDKNRKVIKDILTQIVRNSINHGIETYRERKDAGKPLDGKISLISQKKDDEFFTLIISDDGRGLDQDQLKNKAAQMSGAAFKEIDSWDDEKIRQLIFKPGFSTQKAANLTAGRGIGMDIIRKAVEDNGGKISVESKRGKFFRVKIDLPYMLNG